MTASTDLVAAPILIDVPASRTRGKGRLKVRQAALSTSADLGLQLAPAEPRCFPEMRCYDNPAHATLFGPNDASLDAGMSYLHPASQGGCSMARCPASMSACPSSTTQPGSCCARGSPLLLWKVHWWRRCQTSGTSLIWYAPILPANHVLEDALLLLSASVQWRLHVGQAVWAACCTGRSFRDTESGAECAVQR